MQKLVLMSILIATFVIPARLRRQHPLGIGYKALVRPFIGFCCWYVFALLYLYPRL